MKLEYFTRFFFTLAVIFGVWNDTHSVWLCGSLLSIAVSIEIIAYKLKGADLK